jgi:hypothetical protein
MYYTNDVFNRFFIRVRNVSLQLLQIKYYNIIVMIISYIRLRTIDTEQILYSQSRIHRSQQQNKHSPYPKLLVYINCY